MGAGVAALAVKILTASQAHMAEAQVLWAMSWGTYGFEVVGLQSLCGGPGWRLLPEGGWVGLPSSVQPSEVGRRFHPSPP